MHTEGIKWNCIAQGWRPTEKEREKENASLSAMRLPDVYLDYSSPAEHFSLEFSATDRVARRTGGMRSTSNSDGHNPFILQNAIIAGRSRRSDSHCEDNDAASG